MSVKFIWAVALSTMTCSVISAIPKAGFTSGSTSVLAPVVSYAQQKQTPQKEIKGTVKDTSGEGLIGATLVVKGTTTGFITDLDGNFVLSGISFPATLIVSYIGYSDVEITVRGNESSLEVVLDDSMIALNEVVVVGYGTQKKVNLTGAVSVIDGKELNARPVTNTAMALQGADPSLLLTTGNGSIAGDQYSVAIRGSVSLNSGDPLILIDGIEGSLHRLTLMTSRAYQC